MSNELGRGPARRRHVEQDVPEPVVVKSRVTAPTLIATG